MHCAAEDDQRWVHKLYIVYYTLHMTSVKMNLNHLNGGTWLSPQGWQWKSSTTIPAKYHHLAKVKYHHSLLATYFPQQKMHCWHMIHFSWAVWEGFNHSLSNTCHFEMPVNRDSMSKILCLGQGTALLLYCNIEQWYCIFDLAGISVHNKTLFTYIQCICYSINSVVVKTWTKSLHHFWLFL